MQHAGACDQGTDAAELQDSISVQFDVHVHGAGHGDEVYLCGSDEALGGWKQERAVRMFGVRPWAGAPCGRWRCRVSLPREQHFKYKYVWRRDGQWGQLNPGASLPEPVPLLQRLELEEPI